MKKFLSILFIGLMFSIKSFAVITVLPTSLAGANDTAYCQFTYSKYFTASGGTTNIYHFTVSSGSLPTGMTLDSISGLLSGTVSYQSATSVAFTIKARQTTGSVSGTRAYTLYVRNKTFSKNGLTNIWSTGQLPSRANINATWWNVYTKIDTAISGLGSSFWKLNGNTITTAKGIGSNDNVGLYIETNNRQRMNFTANGRVGVGKTPTLEFDVVGRVNSDSSYYLYGYKSLYYPAGVTTNFASGFESGNSNTSGINSTSVGFRSLKNVTTASYNTAIGSNAMILTTTGDYSTAVGYGALSSNTTGVENTAIGVNALRDNISTPQNVAVGNGALRNNTGTSNIGIGHNALVLKVTGDNNIAIGSQTGLALTSGSANTFVGDRTATVGSLTTGSFNTIVGAGYQPSSNISNNVILTDGAGNVKFRTTATNEISIVSDSVSTAVATASTNKVKIIVNGVTYYFLVTTTP